jgi:hypothetical protein
VGDDELGVGVGEGVSEEGEVGTTTTAVLEDRAAAEVEGSTTVTEVPAATPILMSASRY